MKTGKSTLLEQAAKIAASKPAVVQTIISEQERTYQQALKKVLGSIPVVEQAEEAKQTPTNHDKGMFGNRQVEFTGDVYHIPSAPANDLSQPTGLLTQKDLTNYCVFRKNDRLTFKYVSGDAGNCQYEAKKNGHDTFSREYKWCDGLIQELIDEGACKLI
jgi:hypothetical protein